MPTPEGEVRIRSFNHPEEIRPYRLDDQFRTYSRYTSLYTKRKSLEKIIEQPDATIVLAFIDGNRIVGLGVLAYPDSTERWSELAPRFMMEIKAVEVARRWRSGKIASRIIKMIVAHPLIEDKIIYMVGYSWTWDLEGTGKTAQAYRQMLIRLFKPYGFDEYQTNEPNVCLKPENLFMCHVGKNVSEVILNRFKWLRFGLSPWRWTD